MRKFLLTCLAGFVLCSTATAQDDNETRPAAVGFSLIQNDYLSAYRIRNTSLSSVFANKQWAKFNEMDKGLAFHYFKGLDKHIDFAGTLYGVKTKNALGIGNYTSQKLLLGLNAAANFKLTTEKYWVQPYLIAGIGAHMFAEKYFGAYLYPGAGFKVNFHDNVHFFVQGQYNVPVTPGTSAYHFSRQIGLAFRVGKPKETAAPAPPPPPPPAPVVKDTDGDGIPDDQDACPTVAGPAENKGCPWPDTDGDGVPDKDDKCPTVPGPASNNGCPVVKEEVKKKIDGAAKAIYFVTNGDKLEKRSFPALNTILEELKADADIKADIAGHTDNVGKDAYNQALSERRAKAVLNWLVENGISENRLTAAGYGETQPVGDNNTAEGRQQNRRTEIKLHYE